MPFKSENKRVSRKYDRRVRLTDKDKREIVQAYQSGLASIRGLARLYGVDKRLIQFILFPERQERNIELREQRGGSSRYYDKEKHRGYMKTHRQHKETLRKKGLI